MLNMAVMLTNAQKSSSPEALYVASGTLAHHSLLNCRPNNDCCLFFGKVNFLNFYDGELIVYPCSGVRPSSAFTISKIFFSETAWPIKLKFYMEPPCIVALKFCSRYFGHMTKMATKPIYGKKPFKNLLLQNRQADSHETWYVALGTPAHHSLLK